MAWELTLFFVHLAALAGCLVLYGKAPCWMQKLVVFGLGLAMTCLTIAYGGALFSAWWWWYLALAGFALEHTAVLLYVFRIIYQGTQWKPSSVPSRSSPI